MRGAAEGQAHGVPPDWHGTVPRRGKLCYWSTSAIKAIMCQQAQLVSGPCSPKDTNLGASLPGKGRALQLCSCTVKNLPCELGLGSCQEHLPPKQLKKAQG